MHAWLTCDSFLQFQLWEARVDFLVHTSSYAFRTFCDEPLHVALFRILIQLQILAFQFAGILEPWRGENCLPSASWRLSTWKNPHWELHWISSDCVVSLIVCDIIRIWIKLQASHGRETREGERKVRENELVIILLTLGLEHCIPEPELTPVMAETVGRMTTWL